ncbi:LysR family transcriptional regulator [Hyalangium versicolor]|uniref:LysR family transcriptional regulator n=1 Tax=Hyalangium versicolor TaxID=2861190 RepID=UPI001CCE7DAA|nr:LysR family transcriptional regulator [Hyalangium versicolor]
MFDWEDLHHFAALAREGSLSAAARRLYVDHATVARRVSALETSLALKLVDRRPRSYVLTVDGERIAALAARMEEQAFTIGRAARAVQGLAGEVTISAPPTMSATLIAPRLRELRRLHPALHVRLLGEKRFASLSRREADIAVRLSRPAEKALVARKIGSFSFSLYASPGYLAEHSAETYEFIAYDEGLDDVPQQQWLKAIAGTRPIVLRMNDLEGQRAAARAGVGIAALPHFLGDGDSGLQRVDVESKPVSRDVWLVVHRDLRRAPPVRAVMAFLEDCLG